jgi:putative ubiquitin-RnfH superfamily antitoxin RatB of RatAB toxin-antitoxin module
MAEVEFITVEVAYAKPDKQLILTLEVPAGSTVQQVIEHSVIMEKFPEIDLATARLGIFGKLKKPTETVVAGDRVEIYRPLIADPKEVRKQRAAAGKQMKKGGGDAEPES